jgi:hypothetical protein
MNPELKIYGNELKGMKGVLCKKKFAKNTECG